MSNKKTTKTKPEPRRYDTPAADAITAPSLKRHAVLPLVDVGSRQFEEICRDLMRQNFPDLRPAMKRRSGQPQFGVDVEGFNDLQEPAVVISAKCYKEIQAWEFRAWIEDFTKHLGGHWKGKGVKEFVIAVAIERNDDDMRPQRKLVSLQQGHWVRPFPEQASGFEGRVQDLSITNFRNKFDHVNETPLL